MQPPLSKSVSAMRNSMTSNLCPMIRGAIKSHLEAICRQSSNNDIDIMAESATIMPSDYIEAYHRLLVIGRSLLR